MNDARIVRSLEPRQYLPGIIDHVVEAYGASPEKALERRTFIARHGDERSSVRRLIDLVYRTYIRMIKSGSRARFLHEALARSLVETEIAGKELERDGPMETNILGAVDDSHAAASELFDDAEMRNGMTGEVLPALYRCRPRSEQPAEIRDGVSRLLFGNRQQRLDLESQLGIPCTHLLKTLRSRGSVHLHQLADKAANPLLLRG